MRKWILVFLSILPLMSISFAAQAALKADGGKTSIESKSMGGSESHGAS